MTRAKNKIITTLLAVTMAFSLTACGVSQDNSDSATPLSEQITTIYATLTEMQTLDTTLDGYIDTLESKIVTLETDLAAVNADLETLEENSAAKTALTETKTALENEIKTIKADITALQAKDTELDGKITALQTALSTEITDTEKWVEDTYATKAACDTLKTGINASISALDGKVKTLETSVSSLATVTALQTQVEKNKQNIADLTEYIENLKNCINEKHVFDTESEITYTWVDDYSACTATGDCEYCGETTETVKSSCENGITTATFLSAGLETQTIILTYADNMTADLLKNAVTSLIAKGETAINLDYGNKHYFGEYYSHSDCMSIIVNEAIKSSAAVDGTINVTIKGENAGKENYTFMENPKLKTVTLLDAVELGMYCFFNCENLTAVYLPSATYFIGNTFLHCLALTTIELTALGEFTLINLELPGNIFNSNDDLSEINLVLNADKKASVQGNTWNVAPASTFKSITFVE